MRELKQRVFSVPEALNEVLLESVNEFNDLARDSFGTLSARCHTLEFLSDSHEQSNVRRQELSNCVIRLLENRILDSWTPEHVA